MERKKIFIILAVVIAVSALNFNFIAPQKAEANILENISGFIDKLKFWEKKSPEIESSENFDGILGGETGFLKNEDPESYRSLIQYEEAVINAIDKSAPGVVSIVVSKDVEIIEQCPVTDPFFGPGFKFYVPCPSGKTEKQEIGGGTGFFVSSNGLVLTNKHVVIDQEAEYTVFFGKDNKYDAEVIGVDEIEDLALLKVEGSEFPVLALGNSDSVRLGQTAIAIGNALGEFKDTVSVGVISGLSRTITATNSSGSSEIIENVFQTDAAINPGNSGGPLINLKGEVIGINTAIASGAENIGFAIPINKARRVVETYQKQGKITSAYLGVWYERTDEGAKVGGNSNPVMPDSPAEKAGLKEGDLIVKANGKDINKDRSLSSVISELSPGDTLAMKVKRGEETLNISAVLEERD
ncbi:MAG: trypsin-like peptidase domain-containing protein [Candidatus Colwellbacteria bacterium]|jgi:serine protease Do|nr:trypsin-like peptidase domain-containing protein [Candidatus Colwellbacteria bacterium]MCK9497728.1 trypsin-like peptidase domain-containing protein [Candidatus Colwellbacteria bacterium]MDD3752647.1 trypsin-like peptidase domain-containing protein [Candidatus Colwellbacteria bacterium]MDD4818961.1 trypsin-like peptidase domain-containing protein [Candidatus Colwellbacteria bacterium]